jgi:hypothetical protein
MTLDNTVAYEDVQTRALGVLAAAAVNSELEDILTTKAVERVFGAPMPLEMLAQAQLPALCVYRLSDRDEDKGDFVYQHLSTWRLDYHLPATPLDRIDTRWAILRRAWVVASTTLRVGRSPLVNEEVPLPEVQNVLRYVLGSAQVSYGSATPNGVLYPMFRGQMTFQEDVVPPQSFYDDLDKCARLDTFESLHVDWDLLPRENLEVEARSIVNFEEQT